MTRVVVVGLDAAGGSAAYQVLRTARRTGRGVEVVALERTGDTSYSACGIPYWVAGEVAGEEDLVARDPQQHRDRGVDVRVGTTARALDLDRGVVIATGPDGPGEVEVGFDELVLATGSEPIVPRWARADDGSTVPGILPVKTLAHGRAWVDALASGAHAPRRAVVVGGGYIGIEMAEAVLARGLEVALLTLDEVMPTLDPDMGARVRDALVAGGVKVHPDTPVTGVVTDATGVVTGVATADREIPADVVVLGTGVRPATAVGREAGLPVGRFGGYVPDETARVTDAVWAAGDCCETVDLLTGERTYLPLGTHANKQGRVAGANLAGGSARFRGTLGTAITRFVGGGTHVEIARTGLSSDTAARVGLDPVSSVTEGRTASGYMPEARPMATKVLADQGSRRLLGLQIVGGQAAGKRIDTAAATLWHGGTVDDLATMDLAYAPPFATVWEAVQLAARRLADEL